MSGGRLDVGFGRGTFGYEYGGFGVDEDEAHARIRESVRIVQGLWTTPEFSHEGEFYTLNKLNLVPPPLQSPHPPIYIAASYTQATLGVSGAERLQALHRGRAGHAAVAGPLRRYLALSADMGRTPRSTMCRSSATSMSRRAKSRRARTRRRM